MYHSMCRTCITAKSDDSCASICHDIIKIYKTSIRMKLWCVFVCQVWSFRGGMLRSRCSSGARRDRRRFPAVEHRISIGVWV